jgi:hypothetical protein
MVLECYFDGANKPAQEYDLAMACGMPKQWRSFNAGWNDLLEHYPAPPLHTTYAATLNGDFCRQDGWDHDRVDAISGDCPEPRIICSFALDSCIVALFGLGLGRSAVKALPRERSERSGEP